MSRGAGPGGSNKIQLPLWPTLGFAALVLVALTVLATLVLTRSPSESSADKIMERGRAILETREALEQPGKTVKGATFTPGVYAEIDLSECQQDAAKVVACYDLFIHQGRIEDAQKLVAPNIAGAPKRVSKRIEERRAQGYATPTSFQIIGISLSGQQDFIDPSGPFVTNQQYLVLVEALGEGLTAGYENGYGRGVMLRPDGTWIVTGG